MTSRRIREYNQAYDHLDDVHLNGARPFLDNLEDKVDVSNRHTDVHIKFNQNQENLILNKKPKGDIKVPKVLIEKMQTIFPHKNRNNSNLNRMPKEPPRKRSQILQKLKAVDESPEIKPDVDNPNVGEDSKSDSEYEEEEGENPQEPEVIIADGAPNDSNKELEKPPEKEKTFIGMADRNPQLPEIPVPDIAQKALNVQPQHPQQQEQQPQQQNMVQPQEEQLKAIMEHPLGKVIQQIQAAMQNGGGVQGVPMAQPNMDQPADMQPDFVNPLGLDFDAIEPRALPNAPGMFFLTSEM